MLLRLSCNRNELSVSEYESLQKHVNSLKKNLPKRFQCSFCEYSSETKTNFQRHLVTHKKVKPFKCTHCNQSYKRKCHLTAHVKWAHTKESKPGCKVCNKIFNDRSNLLRHVRAVHDKIKSFVCTTCSKKFAHKVDLTRHVRIHTKNKPYKCSFCDATFLLTQVVCYSTKSETTPGNFLVIVKFVQRVSLDPVCLKSMFS